MLRTALLLFDVAMLRCLPGHRSPLLLISACFSSGKNFQRRSLTARVGFLRHSLRQECIIAATWSPLRSLGTVTEVQQDSPESRNGSGSASLTFQEAIVQLQKYWTSVGCTLWQPHNSEVICLTKKWNSSFLLQSLACLSRLHLEYAFVYQPK